MKRTTTTQFLAFVIIVVGTTQVVHAQSGKKIQIEESLWLQLTDEPGHHMFEAHRAFKGKDRARASRDLRKAAVFLQIAAANSTKNAEPALSHAAVDLLAVADGVDNGTVLRIDTLEYSFARAEHALAAHHHELAEESWSQKERRLAGYRMRAAGNALERGAKWSGVELDSGARATVESSRRLGQGMIRGTGVFVDEIGQGLNSLGRGISGFGQRLEK